jgi:phage terminase Nu1 subunit (DNA packaging protein)
MQVKCQDAQHAAEVLKSEVEAKRQEEASDNGTSKAALKERLERAQKELQELQQVRSELSSDALLLFRRLPCFWWFVV